MVQVLDDGTVAVSYYDFRNNTADGGADPDRRVRGPLPRQLRQPCQLGIRDPGDRRSFDSRKAPVARGFFLGDYEGSAPMGRRSSRSSP